MTIQNTATAWFPVALSADLPAQIVMPIWLPPVGRIALWRSAAGTLSACADRCPHRGMRLSYGFVRDAALSCIYHGWRYGQDGQCLKIPAHPALKPPSAIRVATYAAIEADGIVWAAAEPDDASPPPATTGWRPLRSLEVDAEPAVIGAMSQRPDIRLLLSPAGSGKTLMHVLVPDDSLTTHYVAASRHAEDIRRRAEQPRLSEAEL